MCFALELNFCWFLGGDCGHHHARAVRVVAVQGEGSILFFFVLFFSCAHTRDRVEMAEKRKLVLTMHGALVVLDFREQRNSGEGKKNTTWLRLPPKFERFAARLCCPYIRGNTFLRDLE